MLEVGSFDMFHSDSRLIRVHKNAAGGNTTFVLPGAVFTDTEFSRHVGPVTPKPARQEVADLINELWLIKDVNAVYLRPVMVDGEKSTSISMYRRQEGNSVSWFLINHQVFLILRRRIADWGECDLRLEYHMTSADGRTSTPVEIHTLHA